MRLLAVLVPILAVVAAVAAASGGLVVGVSVGLVGGVALAAALHLHVDRSSRRLAQRIGAGLTVRDEAALGRGGPGWRRLESAVEAMLASHERGRDRLVEARELRIELVDALHVPAVLFDRAGGLVRANAASQEKLGIAEHATSPMQAVANANLAGAVEEAMQARRPIELETTAGGRHLVVVAAPVGDEVLLIVTDETDRRRVADVRRDFVVNASHELKTPVAAIQALADALRVTIGRDPDRAASLVEHLGEESGRLAKLVHELLNLRRLEEPTELSRTALDLADLVRGEVARLRSRAARREVEVELEVPDEATLVGVEQDLCLVVGNLLDNAIVYNRRGGRVRVGLSRSGATWRLEVADTGIGIPRSDIDRIFERFYRVDVARSRATGGTGLGLAIVRHAVEGHGGSVSVDSALGEGTTFTVDLPTVRPG